MAVGQHDQEERRHLHQGFGAALSNAFEIAMVPVVFGGIGWLVDHLLGTGWIVAGIFAAIGLLGTFTKLYYRYNESMLRLEQAGSWNRPTQAPR